ncbi:MAG: hypothetical protein KDK70_06745 [Myxococcales bacterium]|nr:hypothetical protein [Myxococcales bacterium]
MNDTIDTKDIDQDIELVDIEDLRTAFGGEDLSVQPESETNLVNAPTTMCSGWR